MIRVKKAQNYYVILLCGKIMIEDLQALAYVAKHSNDMIIITDSNGYIQWVNNTYEKLIGYSVLEATGKKIGSLFQGEETDKNCLETLSAAIINKESVSIKMKIYHRRGSTFWVDLSLVPVFDSFGEIRYFNAIGRDITQLVEYEHHLSDLNKSLKDLVDRRTKELSEVNADLLHLSKEKDKIIRLVAHDLKNPLHSIALTAELMEMTFQRYNPELLPEYGKLIDRILQTTSKMNEVILDFLSINNIHLGHLNSYKEWTRIQEVCEIVLGAQNKKAQDKSIQLNINVQCENKLFIDQNAIL